MIGLVGSRSVSSPVGRPLIASVVRHLERIGASAAVGDSRGVESLAIAEIRQSSVPLNLLSIGAATGRGSWPGAIPVKTFSAAARGAASCLYWSGGECHCRKACHCLRRRLLSRQLVMARSLAYSVAAGEKAGLVAIWQHPGSRSTWRACSVAAARGVPIAAYTLGFDPAELQPLAPGGRWSVRSCEVTGARRALWLPAEKATELTEREREEAKTEAWRRLSAERARDQADTFVWSLESYGSAQQIETWRCFSQASGRDYRVTAEACTCPHYVNRCRARGIACKHQLALASYLRAFEHAEAMAECESLESIEHLAA